MRKIVTQEGVEIEVPDEPILVDIEEEAEEPIEEDVPEVEEILEKEEDLTV